MKKIAVRRIFFVLSIVIAIGIFLFSAQNGEKSGGMSDHLTEKILYILSRNPEISENPSAERVESVGLVLRKAAHFAEYLAFGASVCAFAVTYEIRRGMVLLAAFGVSALYAISDEVHQYFIPGRHASVWDVLLDSMGALCGILIVLGIVALIRHRRMRTGAELRKKSEV